MIFWNKGPEADAFKKREKDFAKVVDSFEALSDDPDHARALIFIRAPRITRVGEEVEVVDTFDGEPVLVRSVEVVGLEQIPKPIADVVVRAAAGALKAGQPFEEDAFEKARGVGLVEEPGLEIEPGGQSYVRVARPRVAVDAAVLATPVRIDRQVEADVGRVVAGQDSAHRLVRDHGVGRGLLFLRRLLQRACVQPLQGQP